MKKHKLAYVIFATSIVGFGGFLFGYSTSVISGALLYLTRQFNLSIFDQSMIVSVILIGAIIGAFFGGMLTDKVGRKNSLFITAILFFIGTLLLVTSEDISGLIIGRFISGIGVGLASLIVPLYISEIAPTEYRGSLVAVNQFSIVIGILVAYIINYVFASDANWRLMFAFTFVPTIILFLGAFFIPETPSWLASHKKMEKAIKMLKKLKNYSSDEEIIVELEHKKAKDIVSWKHLFTKTVLRALIAGVGISVFQQLTGINTIIYYSPKIFQLAGFESAKSAIFATIGVGVVNFLMTIVAIMIIDKVGRKKLLIIGLSGMAFSLTLLGISFFMPIDESDFISILCLLIYIAFFAVSIGPLAWVIISEIFPMGVRGRAMGICTFANWVCNYLVSLSFLYLIEFFGKSSTFWLYAVICLIAIWFVIKKIPETKGKSFEAIQSFWKKEVKDIV